MTQTEYESQDIDKPDKKGIYPSQRMIGFTILYIILVVSCCVGLLVWVNKDKVIPVLLELIQWAINYY